MKIQKFVIAILVGIMIGFTCSKKQTVGHEVKTVSYEQPIEGTDMVLTLKCVYPLFEETSPFWHHVNETIIDKMKASTFDESTHATFDDLWKTFTSEHKTATEEFPDFVQPWALDRNAEIVFQNSEVLSIQFNSYQNTGGAHPNSFMYYLNYDLKNRRELTLEDIIPLKNQPALLQIAEKTFRQAQNIPDSSGLNEQGFFFEDNQFQLAKSFTIQKEGLLLYYNPYEIAPYAAGPIELLLPFDQLEDIINPQISFAFLTVKKG